MFFYTFVLLYKYIHTTMNKSLLFILFSIIYGVTNLSAQCTPIPFGGGSLTNPDTTQGIAPAAETQAYEQIIHMRIPADTNIAGSVIAIDSVGITDILGIPNNFTWLTNSQNNYWPGDTFGCIIFQGNPVVGQAGSYVIEIKAKVRFFGQLQSYNMYYDFVILDASHVGFNLIKKEELSVLQNIPNPFNQKTIIKYFSPNNNNVSLVVYDILGNIVYNKVYDSARGNNSINFERGNLRNGVYIYELRNGNKIVRKRMVIK